MHDFFMKEALKYAEIAAEQGEIPVGAVIVREGKILCAASNRRESEKNALYHAEIIAIDNACLKLGGWRLPKCDLYVTLEPCPMCAGAIINSRIENVYFGAYDKKNGAFGSVVDLSKLPFTHRPSVFGGILEEECSAELSNFFKELRNIKTKK